MFPGVNLFELLGCRVGDLTLSLDLLPKGNPAASIVCPSDRACCNTLLPIHRKHPACNSWCWSQF